MWQDRRGATAVEFALMLGIGAAMLVIALNNLSMSVGTSMSDAAGVINSSVCNSTPGVGLATATPAAAPATGSAHGPPAIAGGPCP